jgi:hypothetical protein
MGKLLKLFKNILKYIQKIFKKIYIRCELVENQTVQIVIFFKESIIILSKCGIVDT